ncbi:MAG: hypothetical protein OEU32_07450 [Acidimicrobiia bacterium]|nr:hypothetical protein [Acidimicrobiia bacterium]
MNKKLVIGTAAGCAVIAAVAATRKRSSAGPRPTMWDKMQACMEQMPEDFPPRIMFDNVEATRRNTERILEQVEQQQRSEDDIEVFAPS